jgi:hypothetical protein
MAAIPRPLVTSPILSILICTVSERADSLKSLLKVLEPQISKSVEVLWLGDNFSMSVGEKRNHLLRMAKGMYVSFIDDDDSVSDNYCQSILNACNGATLITFKGAEYYSETKIFDFVFDKKNNLNWKDRPAKIHHLMPNHLCAWRRDIIKEPFPEINKREDHLWAEKMIKHIDTVNHIDDYLYHYFYSKKNSLTH